MMMVSLRRMRGVTEVMGCLCVASVFPIPSTIPVAVNVAVVSLPAIGAW